jgi:hypothetical protein
MAALTARNVHLSDQALAAGITNVAREQEAWRVLDRLARQGQVERIRLPEALCRYWRYVGGGRDV